jgi:hypothetical protein
LQALAVKQLLCDERGGKETRKPASTIEKEEAETPEAFTEIDCPVSDPQASLEALGGGPGTTEYDLVRDFIDALETGQVRPPIDVIKAMDMTVPGICAHEAAMTGRWIDVPLFDW